MKKIAVLITCHNRREKTLTCLHALYNCKIPDNYIFDVFLVDDGSTDATSEEVNNRYPTINIIQGNGNLYWNRGMRLAWEMALRKNNYDFFLWLNDDTILFDFTFLDLLNCYYETLENGNPSIIVGSCQYSEQIMKFSYGGKTDNGPVIPNGELQHCEYINGNVVLVPYAIYKKLGILSSEYTHTMGDYDYGLRAIQSGFNCYTTKMYIAICPTNEGLPGWCNPKVSFKKRWQLMHSSNGLNLKEYIVFRKKFWSWRWIIYVIKAYAKVLSPKIYNTISKTWKNA